MEPGMFPEPLLVQIEGGRDSESLLGPDTPSPPSNRYKRPLQADELTQDDRKVGKRMTKLLEGMEKAQQALLEELQAKTADNEDLKLLICEASGQIHQFEILTLQQMNFIREQSLRLELQRQLEQDLRRDIAQCQIGRIEQLERKNREIQQLRAQLAGKQHEVKELRWQVAQPVLQQLEEDSASSEQQVEEYDAEEDSASSVPRARQTQSV